MNDFLSRHFLTVSDSMQGIPLYAIVLFALLALYALVITVLYVKKIVSGKNHDRLTGMLNLQGFEDAAERLFHLAKNHKFFSMEQLIAEARELAEGGVTELTVIAQDTSAYGVDLYGEPKLAELLKELAKIEKLHWVRLLYTYPNTVDEKLIDTIRDDPKLCNYIDMPIQHINAELLTAMNRHGSAEHIRYITDYVRRSSPDFILRTTAIVGFPGETEEQFSDLMEFFDSHP